MRKILPAVVILLLCGLSLTANLGLVEYQNTAYELLDTLKPVISPNGTVTLATAGNDYVDAIDSKTYGTSTTDPPAGAGNPDTASTDITEASYVSTSYTTLETADMSALPPTGWTNTNFVQQVNGGNPGYWARCLRSSKGTPTSGSLYTKTYDLTGATGSRVTFYYLDSGTDPLEAGDFSSQVYQGAAWVTKWSSPASPPTSWTQVQYTDPWAASGFRVNWLIYLGTNGEGVGLDTITIEKYTTSTFYRVQMVFRFDSVDYNTYASEVLYCNVPSSSSADTINWYGGTTSSPSTLIKSAQAGNTNWTADIHATLTGATYYVKIVDVTQDGDTTQSTWKFCQLYICLTNAAPVNGASATCTNLDDTDNLYAMYKTYLFSSSVTDADGYANIHYVQLSGYLNPTIHWALQYHEDDNSFSKITGDVNIVSGSCSAVRSGTGITLAWGLSPMFNFTDTSDIDLRQYSEDADGASDTDTYDVNYDYESRLDLNTYAVADSLADATRGPINGALTASGTVTYFGSSLNPPSDQVDVWVSCSDVAGSPWSDLTLSSGAFSMSVSADDVSGVDTYACKVVLEGAGSAGADQLHTSHSTTYTADRIIIDVWTSDSIINTGSASDCFAYLHYESNYEVVDTGSWTIGASPAVPMYYNAGRGAWNLTETYASPTYRSYTYGNVTQTANDEYGISTLWIDTGRFAAQYWDRIKVFNYTVSDSRDNVNEAVTIDAWIDYELYAGDPLATMTVTINGYATTHLSGNLWRATVTKSTVQEVTFNTVAVSGDQYGLTVVNQNSQSTNVIWDRGKITGLYANNTSPGIGGYVLFNLTTVYEFDNTSITAVSGFLLENISLSYNSGLGVWEATDHRDGATAMTYDGVTGTATLYGIDVWNMNGWSVTVTWNVTATSVTITVWISYGWTVTGYNVTLYYSGVYYPNGDPWTGTATFNTTGGTLYPSYATIGNRTFVVVSITDPLYGLTSFTANPISCVWDKVQCSAIGWAWLQNDLSSIWMVTATGVFTWAVNGSLIGSGVKIQSYVNGTANDWANTDGGSEIGTLWIGTFNGAWYHAHLEGIAENIAVGSRNFDSEFWDSTLPVPTEHSIHIASFSFQELPDKIWFALFTIWGNSTITVWDNDTLVAYRSQEGAFYLSKDYLKNLLGYSGLHNLTILVNATDTMGQSHQIKNFATSDYWLWINYQFNIPAVLLNGESVIRNELGSPNIIEVQMYSWMMSDQQYPLAQGISINLTMVVYYVPNSYWTNPNYPTMGMWCEWHTYQAWRQTDSFGRVYWVIDPTFAALICNAGVFMGPYAYSPYFVLYANGQEIGQYVCLRWWTPIVSGAAQPGGVNIIVDPAYAYLTVNNTRYEYVTISGIPNGYSWTVSAQYSGTWHNFQGIGNIGDIFIPDPIKANTNFTVTIYQSLAANVIFAQQSFVIQVNFNLQITGGVAIAQETTVSYSADTNQACTVWVYESGHIVGAAVIPQAGSFSLWWNRSIGLGSVVARLYFFTPTSSVTQNVTYAKIIPWTNAILDALGNLTDALKGMINGIVIPTSYDPTSFVLMIVGVLFLAIFTGGILQYWNGKGEAKRRYEVAVATGQTGQPA
jgi:hypothetical protein